MRITAILLFLAAVSLEAQPARYREWGDSPQALFMTAVERKEWKSLRRDEQAEAFIRRFIERRGGSEFKQMVEHRTAIADKFFTHPKVKGSQSLRGKLVILLGAPKDITTSKLLAERARLAAPSAPSPEVVTQINRDQFGVGGSAPRLFRMVTLTYPDHAVTIRVEEDSGRDRLANKSEKKQLDARMEAAIAASVRKP